MEKTMESKKKVYEPPVVVRLSQVGKMASAEGQGACSTGTGVELPNCVPGSAARLCNAGAGITFACSAGSGASLVG